MKVGAHEFLDLALAAEGAVGWTFDANTGEVTWFAGMDTLLGLPGAAEDDIRARLLELIEPWRVATEATTVAQDLELEQPVVGTDGQTRFLQLYARRLGDRRPAGLFGLIRDITELHRDRQALAGYADRYRLIVELSPDAICIHQDRIIRYANPAMHTIVGAAADEQLAGRALTDFVAEDSIPSMRRRLDALESPGAVTPRAQAELRRVDGSTVPVEMVAVHTTWQGRPAVQVIGRDITAQKAAEATLRYQATHDDLTGLLNRKGITDTLAELTGSSRRQTALVFCDIDNFKRINDSLGHEAGDELLTVIARRLQLELPTDCTVARLSGDEFLIIKPDIETEGLETLATTVSEALRTRVPLRNQLVSVSVSTGAAMLEESMTGADLLRYADMAMFHAKSRGPGRTSLAHPALITALEGQLHWEEQLREAIRTDALTLHYQPIVDRTRTIVAAEALVRWPHPQRGLLSPGVILPVAEQGNLLRELDRWVLRTALHEATTWPINAGDHVTVTVNLAELLPGDAYFTDEVTALLDDSGLDPHRLILELLETSLVELPAPALQTMTDLAGRGVRFALDDFGTGYSSLARLRDIPAQILKLDRRFTTRVETDAIDHAIMRAVIDMARAMGHTTVAEGIETSSQLHTLTELGIDHFQGYLFSHPLPADQFRAQLAVHDDRQDPRSS